VLLCLICIGQPDARLARAEMASAGVFDVDAMPVEQPKNDYVPPPAKQYALTTADAPNFTSIKDPGEGKSYEGWLLAFDAKFEKDRRVLSETDVSMIVTNIQLGARGSASEVADKYRQLVEKLAGEQGASMTPIESPGDDWLSDQVTMVTRVDQDMTIRRYVLQYGNAIVRVEGHGKEAQTSPERVKQLARIVETKLSKAAQ
jgi:hypothetical protein